MAERSNELLGLAIKSDMLQSKSYDSIIKLFGKKARHHTL